MQASDFMIGVELMLAGMGTVVSFLLVLILATSAMSHLITRTSPAPEDGVTEEELAAITAAVHQHRRRG